MAEYIKREKLINRLHNAEENYKADHDYDIDNDPFSDGILSAMFSVNQIVGTEPTADVIERYKIDKAIEEIENEIKFWDCPVNYQEPLEVQRTKQAKANLYRQAKANSYRHAKANSYRHALEIIKSNIGE